jgi:hypothetical protein
MMHMHLRFLSSSLLFHTSRKLISLPETCPAQLSSVTCEKVVVIKLGCQGSQVNQLSPERFTELAIHLKRILSS